LSWFTTIESLLAGEYENAPRQRPSLDALDEENRILLLLLVYLEGTITALKFARRVRGAVPDPLAG
jgi:hypothetical protein